MARLGISDVTVACEPVDMMATAWGNAIGYHPGWVCHGLLVGPAASAAVLLHRLLDGALLPPTLLSEMLSPHPVGGPVRGRPWRTAGHGLGLMIGIGETGSTYVGHTGGGPGSSAAIYQHQPDLQDNGPRRTVAAFASAEHPARVELQVMDLARR